MRPTILAAGLGLALLGLGGCAVYPAGTGYYAPAAPPVVVSGAYVSRPPPPVYYRPYARPYYGPGYGYGWRRW